jgi:hypothetical protein
MPPAAAGGGRARESAVRRRRRRPLSGSGPAPHRGWVAGQANASPVVARGRVGGSSVIGKTEDRVARPSPGADVPLAWAGRGHGRGCGAAGPRNGGWLEPAVRTVAVAVCISRQTARPGQRLVRNRPLTYINRQSCAAADDLPRCAPPRSTGAPRSTPQHPGNANAQTGWLEMAVRGGGAPHGGQVLHGRTLRGHRKRFGPATLSPPVVHQAAHPRRSRRAPGPDRPEHRTARSTGPPGPDRPDPRPPTAGAPDPPGPTARSTGPPGAPTARARPPAAPNPGGARAQRP